jgi:glycerol-3-phosphate dehydrogenase
MNKKVIIIGNGQIGHAILHLLKGKDLEVLVWDNDHSKNISGKKLDEILPGADFLFLCIPSWYMEEALSEISLSLDPKTILISLSKGMNAISHQSMDVLIEAEFPDNRYALLQGPMLATEIMADQKAAAVVATEKDETYEEIASLFAGSKLILEHSAEVHSVALAAVLKNIYTLVIGMLDGLGEGDNTKGYFIAKSMDEILAIMDIAEADMSTGLGVAGLGDFVATASSPHSTNRQVGEEMAKTGKSSKRSEGLVSLPSVLKLVGAKKKTLPLLSLLERIVIDNKDAKTEISKLLN